jgi:ketosteroid isomerase-like protein
MKRLTVVLLLALVFPPFIQPQEEAPANPEMQRQEIVNLELETARAIQLANGTFFRRVYSEDFIGTLSHGLTVSKAELVQTVQASPIRYQSFIASDIRVRIYQNTAIATCLWSSRGMLDGRPVETAVRAIHIYVSGARGWQVVASQSTPLPPYTQQPL